MVGEERAATERSLDALAANGHPVVRLSVAGQSDLGGAFFRWQFATAVACAVLGVNPFDQPDVEESKVNTKRALANGRGRSHPPAIGDDAFGDFVSRVSAGDYVSVLAYVTPTGETDRALATVARELQDHLTVTVTVGYGPRYLHSTGQFHKGGPPRGHFIQLVELPDADLVVPGHEFTFGELARAQADGDRQALEARNRPVVRFGSLAELLGMVERLREKDRQ